MPRIFVFAQLPYCFIILRTGDAGSKGYDPPLRPANFPNPRIFVFA